MSSCPDPTSNTSVAGWYDVTDYGADNSGATDASVGINCAIYAMTTSSANGGVLFFPPGEYGITNAINDIPDNTSIVGCGVSATVIMGCVADVPLLTVPNQAVSVSQIGLAYSSSLAANPNGSAIKLLGSDNVSITDVSITNPLYAGILLDATSGKCSDTTIDQVSIACTGNATAGIEITKGSSPG